MRGARMALLVAPMLVGACAGISDRHTLAELRHVEPDVSEVQVQNGLDQAMAGYRKFLDEAPESSLTPEAMRRLADLKLEKEYGILGDGKPAIPAPEPATAKAERGPQAAQQGGPPPPAAPSESDEAFERRAAAEHAVSPSGGDLSVEVPGQGEVTSAGPREAIELYDRILATYPNYAHNDE